jgi:hypothetical protein
VGQNAAQDAENREAALENVGNEEPERRGGKKLPLRGAPRDGKPDRIAAMNERLKDILTRAETWPDYAQEELAAIASDIEAELKRGIYHPTAEELQMIESARAAVKRGEVATDGEVEAVFAKYRSG